MTVFPQVTFPQKGYAHNQHNKCMTIPEISFSSLQEKLNLQNLNQIYLSYNVFRAKNSLESTEFWPIECHKNKRINSNDSHDTTKKSQATIKIILQMNGWEGPTQKPYSDHIFPEYWPTKTRCEFASLTERKYPDKYPPNTTRKRRTNNTPET